MTNTPSTQHAEHFDAGTASAVVDPTHSRPRSAESIRHFKTSEVVDLLDLSRRQLQYWAKTGLVEPSARTPGGHHRYDFNDLVALKATKRLIDAGVSVQKIRKSVGALRNLLPLVGRPLSELVLVATGDVVLVFHDDTVFEAITGQEWVFAVAAFEREVSDFHQRKEASAHQRKEASAHQRKEASAHQRKEASAHQRKEASANQRKDAAAGSTRDAGFDRRGRAAQTASAERGAADANSGDDQSGKPARPTVRSAKQDRKRWSKTG
jgi:DNA-binding transcriptional MerR regulator